MFTLDATPNGMFKESARANMLRIYGEERIKKSTFAFILCDPLQRSQSYYYHFKAGGKSTGFKGAAHNALRSDHDIPGMGGGMYSNGVDPWIAAVASAEHPVLIIPSVAYYSQPAETLRALIEVVERNSGRTVKIPASCCSDKPPRSNSRSHAHLADDFYPEDAHKVWSKYKSSSYHIYDLVAPNHNPSIVLHPPSIRNKPEYRHFLETTEFLKQFILDPPATPPVAVRAPSQPPPAPPDQVLLASALCELRRNQDGVFLLIMRAGSENPGSDNPH